MVKPSRHFLFASVTGHVSAQYSSMANTSDSFIRARFLCIINLLWYMFLILVVLVKVSVLVK